MQHHNSAEGSCMKSYLESPENTSPPTQTAPSSGSQHSGKTTSGSPGNGSAGQDSAKTKQRKRKKSTTALQPVVLRLNSDTIQPCHIREAVWCYSHKIGPFSPLTSAYCGNGMAFLACWWDCDCNNRKGNVKVISFSLLGQNKIQVYLLCKNKTKTHKTLIINVNSNK